MLAKTSVAVCAATLAIILGLAAAALIPGAQTPIGLLGSAFASSAFASPASAQTDIETVEGEVSGYKYSPSGSHVDGFYLDANGFLPGRTAVGVPPHAASYMPREGSSVEVSGVARTSPHGEEEIHAMSITDNATGRTFALRDPAAMSIPPTGDPGFGLPGPKGKGAAPPPVG